jgi:hypothetical protein
MIDIIQDAYKNGKPSESGARALLDSPSFDPIPLSFELEGDLKIFQKLFILEDGGVDGNGFEGL